VDPKPFPHHRFPNLRELCMAVLKCFSKKSLLLSSAERRPTIAAVRPLEAQYQDEFYRAFTSLLGTGVGISSEWSRDNGGRVNFRILGPKWGVELLRDGTKNTVDEHYKRFLPKGKYYKWISDSFISEWLVIDCRCSTPEEYGKFTSLLHLWVTPLIVISASWAESVACFVCRGLFDAPHFRCRQPRNHARSLLDGLITKGRRDMFLTINCFAEKTAVVELAAVMKMTEDPWK
jgi:hypothetical protein